MSGAEPGAFFSHAAALGQNRLHHVAVHVGQAKIAAGIPIREPRVVESHQVEVTARLSHPDVNEGLWVVLELAAVGELF